MFFFRNSDYFSQQDSNTTETLLRCDIFLSLYVRNKCLFSQAKNAKKTSYVCTQYAHKCAKTHIVFHFWDMKNKNGIQNNVLYYFNGPLYGECIITNKLGQSAKTCN